jgi:hypothetical protein
MGSVMKTTQKTASASSILAALAILAFQVMGEKPFHSLTSTGGI